MLLLLLLAVACRQYLEPVATPVPTIVVRGGELYTCGNGLAGCSVTYRIGPVTHAAGRLRVDFTVTLAGPSGGTTQWTNDTAIHSFLRSQGQQGIAVISALDSSAVYELSSVGGIAAMDVLMIAPVSYEGFWEFAIAEPPGALLLLTYPDFSESPVPVEVPE
jgi:hypothetical protein